ncbi:MAG TPA: hypothetical protein VGE11_09325 [Pseudonocardia sp.]
MPIRSPRGRATAYRALWQWPLRSPGRLAFTGIGLLAVVVAVSVGLGMTTRTAPAVGSPGATLTPTAAFPSGAASTPVPTVLPPVQELQPTTLPLSAAPSAALQVASSWARAWVRPPQGTSTARWLDGLRATTTDEYLGVLSGVDPSNVPATKVTGAARAVVVSPRSVRVRVPTDAVTLMITVVYTDDGWRVSGYDRT